MTAFTELMSRARANAHDITDPSASVTGKDVAERVVGRRVIAARVPADAAANTTIAEHALCSFPSSEFPNGVKVVSVKARYNAVVADGTDAFTDTLKSCDSAGVTPLTLGNFTSDSGVTVPNGYLGETTVTLKAYSMVLSSTPANLVVPAAGALTLTRTKKGAGKAVGLALYEITVEAL